jgi:hypothetical protein
MLNLINNKFLIEIIVLILPSFLLFLLSFFPVYVMFLQSRYSIVKLKAPVFVPFKNCGVVKQKTVAVQLIKRFGL